MNRNKINLFFLLTSALVVLFSVFILSFRHRIESKNKAVGLCLESQVIMDVAAVNNMSLLQTMHALKSVGLTHVCMSEDLLQEMLALDKLKIRSLPGNKMSVEGDSKNMIRFIESFASRFRAKITKQFFQNSITCTFSSVPYKTLMNLSLGIDPYVSSCAGLSGLHILARHANVAGASHEWINFILRQSFARGARAYLPEGEQVLGQRELVSETVSVLNELGMQYVSPEFVKIGGDAKMCHDMMDSLVRLHSIQYAEIDKMSPAEYSERFSKAYRERNIRILMLRPQSQASSNSLLSLKKTLLDVQRAILKQEPTAAFRLPKPIEDPKIPAILYACLGLLSLAWMYFGLKATSLLKLSGVKELLFISGVVLLGGGAYFLPFRSIVSLILACMAPAFGYFLWNHYRLRSLYQNYFLISGVSIVGGLATAALMTRHETLSKVHQFSGVKLTHIVPLIIISCYLVTLAVSFKDFMSLSVKWRQALVGGVVVLAVLVMLMRTGNDNPASVSGLELKFRAILDTFMYVRPRTKEFLLGHPMLWLGLCITAMNAQSKNHWMGLLCLGAGAIGQASIVNTFCHLHTPIYLSVVRVMIGLFLGAVFGLVLQNLYRYFLKMDFYKNA